jgi:hypothetical protein
LAGRGTRFCGVLEREGSAGLRDREIIDKRR